MIYRDMSGAILGLGEPANNETVLTTQRRTNLGVLSPLKEEVVRECPAFLPLKAAARSV